MRFLELTLNEMRVIFIEMKRYWFETLIGYIFITLLFAGIFFGAGFLADSTDGKSPKDGLVFSFIVWVLIWQAYHSVGGKVVENTEKGFIEHLFMGDKSFVYQCITRFLADFVVNIIAILFLAHLFMFISSNWINVDFLLLFGLVFLGLPAMLGLGFLFAGFSLIFKKAASLTVLMMFLMVGVVAVDAMQNNLYSLLPFAHAASLAKSVILHGYPIQLIDISIVVCNSIAYLLLGLFVYFLCEKYAKANNLIGVY